MSEQKKPSWVGLKEVGRTDKYITFALSDGISTGWRSVLRDEVERWEKSQRKVGK